MSSRTSLSISLSTEKWEKLRSLKEEATEAKHPIYKENNLSKCSNSTPSGKEENKNLKKSWMDKREDYRVTIDWLCRTFPLAFNFMNPLPLKLNITKDLYANLPVDGSISKTRLRAGIQYYTHSTPYLKALLQSNNRVDLNGQEVELVLESHKEFTQNILNQRLERKKNLKFRNANFRKGSKTNNGERNPIKI